MSLTPEHAKLRLNNLETIEPLLGALRTISMGTWRLAQKKVAQMVQYEQNYHAIIKEILPHIKPPKNRKPAREDAEGLADSIILILGSERGLCGRFNETLAENAENWINQQGFRSHQIWAMGSKMVRILERMGISIGWRNPLPSGALVSYQDSYLLTQKWLMQFEAYDFNQLTVLYNQPIRGGQIQFASLNIFPYEIDYRASILTESANRWPPPIIETDPWGIYHQIIQHHIASHFYQALLQSAAAENSARYRKMEEAKQNAEEIIVELKWIINAERKRQITQEMQELAVGAGLMDQGK